MSLTKLIYYPNQKHHKVLEEWKEIYTHIGIEVHTTSVELQSGLDQLKELIENKVTLLSGHSGVGKSSLINLLAPNLDLKVKDISAKHDKGVHTTTFATMHHLHDETYIIDTPGIKEFGLAQIEPEELSGYFVEMKERLNDCKYNNCLHRDEPDCAIKEAMVNGEISESRFGNYLQMLDSLEEVNYWERT